jgi:hypothetical protein
MWRTSLTLNCNIEETLSLAVNLEMFAICCLVHRTLEMNFESTVEQDNLQRIRGQKTSISHV